MAVNETVIAMLRPKPNMAKLVDDPAEVRAAAQAVIDAPPGIGTIASYWTEVSLPAIGTWNAPARAASRPASFLLPRRTRCHCCSSRSTTATPQRRRRRPRLDDQGRRSSRSVRLSSATRHPMGCTKHLLLILVQTA
ncbi:hypothetical protein [Streptomyces sp. NPDC002540]